MKKFSITHKKGITDLQSTYPYNQEGMGFAPVFPITEEGYRADVIGYEAIVKRSNELRVQELKESGEYGQEYDINFNFTSHPEFDEPPPINYSNWGILIPKGLRDEPKD